MIDILIYINICILVFGLTSFIILNLSSKNRVYFPPHICNKFLRSLIIISFIAPLISSNFQSEEFIISTTKIEHQAIHSIKSPSTISQDIKFINDIKNKIDLNFFYIIWFILSFLYGVKFIISYFQLMKLIKQSEFVEKRNKINIYCSMNIIAPFAFRGIFKKYIVFPYYLIDSQKSLNSVLEHESWHHQNRDTLWVHFFNLLKIIFFWNPFTFILSKNIEELQELACDEILICRKKISINDYTQALFKVAENSVNLMTLPTGTVGMSMSNSGKKLKRRILNMNWYQNQKREPTTILFSIILFCFAITAVKASNNFVNYNNISLNEAKNLSKSSNGKSSFQIEINSEVVNELNKYIATHKGRKFLNTSLKRKEKYIHIFNNEFKKYNSPNELLAVALIESSFQNFPEKMNRMKSAGVWQFIPSTARNYGLVVNEKIDERMDVQKETSAALRLLNALHLRFNDWSLALLAYNAGENKIQEGINKLNSRDAWKLIDSGYAGDKSYLSKIMAAALILNNPHLIK